MDSETATASFLRWLDQQIALETRFADDLEFHPETLRIPPEVIPQRLLQRRATAKAYEAAAAWLRYQLASEDGGGWQHVAEVA